MRRFFAYVLIVIGIAALLSGVFVPLGVMGPAFLAFGLVAIGIGGGLRK